MIVQKVYARSFNLTEAWKTIVMTETGSTPQSHSKERDATNASSIGLALFLLSGQEHKLHLKSTVCVQTLDAYHGWQYQNKDQ